MLRWLVAAFCRPHVVASLCLFLPTLEMDAVDLVDLVSSDEELEDPDPWHHRNERNPNLSNPDPWFRVLIVGEPRGWKRPKPFTKILGGGRYITNMVDTNKAEKDRISTDVRQQLMETFKVTSFPLYREDIELTMEFEFYRRLPNDAFVASKRSNAMRGLSRSCNSIDKKKPDLDNLVKLMKDALQGVVYQDDKQVVCYKASKMLDVEPPHEGCTLVWFRVAELTDIPCPDPHASIRSLDLIQNGSRLVTNF